MKLASIFISLAIITAIGLFVYSTDPCSETDKTSCTKCADCVCCSHRSNCAADSTADFFGGAEAAEAFNYPHMTYLPEFPKEMSFANEKVPLNRPDVQEALDREILSNTFWHTNTLLILKRRARLFPEIEKILKECGVPDDFKYLCVAESNLSPTAKSPVGAAGLWQIMEKTGKELGLEINEDVDERYNFEKSTRAACQYLKKSYRALGSWTLVAAAYNGGQGRVTKNIETQKQNNYYDIMWVEETGRYVFRILALKLIMNNPQLYGFNLTDTDSYHSTKYYEVKTDTTIADIAQFAIDNKTTYKAIKTLNPWLKQNKLSNPKRKEYTILVPR